MPDPAAFGAFVKGAASRYADGRVAAWGMWNEPNLTQCFEGTKQQWIHSAFVPAIDAIKVGCPGCFVVGPTAYPRQPTTLKPPALAAKPS